MTSAIRDWKRVYASPPVHEKLKKIADEKGLLLNHVVNQFLADGIHHYFQAKETMRPQ